MPTFVVVNFFLGENQQLCGQLINLALATLVSEEHDELQCHSIQLVGDCLNQNGLKVCTLRIALVLSVLNYLLCIICFVFSFPFVLFADTLYCASGVF